MHQCFSVKVTLHSVDVYGKRTLTYGGLPMFLHRHASISYVLSQLYPTFAKIAEDFVSMAAWVLKDRCFKKMLRKKLKPYAF